MALWRRYLEEFAEAEPDVEAQVVVAAYHTVEVFGALGLLLDRERHLRPLIEARNGYFRKGVERAATFDEKLMVAAYGLYNHLNTLARQFAGSGRQGLEFVEAVEKSVEAALELSAPSARASAALRAAFPLLGFMTLMLDPEKRLIEAIRKVEQRFAAGDGKAAGDWDHLLNALYRLVEMLQLFVTLSDAELAGQVQQIAARFQEEDQPADARLKLRNGFCRAFELGHLLTIHLDEVLP
jgi:hypothetical protein